MSLHPFAELKEARRQGQHVVGHEKLRLFGPAVSALRRADFFFAVRATRVLFVRSAVTDVTVDDDERRTAAGFAESFECGRSRR